jgi:hypothetical protein
VAIIYKYGYLIIGFINSRKFNTYHAPQIGKVRRRDTGIDSEELSQSNVRIGTGSETGTQSEEEPDSQSSGEEAKNDK